MSDYISNKIWRGISLLLFLHNFSFSFLLAQAPIAAFSIPEQTCLEQKVVVENQSSGILDFEWDFCEGDLLLNPKLTSFSNTSFSIPVGVSLIRNNDKWYGFLCSILGNSLFRIDFGKSLANPNPSIVNLGNIGGMLNRPQEIKAVEFNGEYVLFVNNREGNKLIRIYLGANIENPVINSDVVLTGNGFENGGLDVFYDGVNWILSLTNDNFLTLLNFGNSPANDLKSDQIMNTAPIPEVSGIGDIKFVNENNIWYAFIVGFKSGTIHRLNFGNNVMSNPSSLKLNVERLSSFQPYGLAVEQDKGKWIAFVTTIQGNFLRLEIGDNVSNANVLFTDFGQLGSVKNTLKMDIAKSDSRWVAITSSWDSNEFHLIEFPQSNCPFQKAFSHNPDTVHLRPLVRGIQFINLRGKDGSEVVASTTKAVEVVAPLVDIFPSTQCVSSPMNLTANNLTPDQKIISYTWTFHDGSQQNTTEANFQFPEPGTYNVRLDVESDDGCNSYLEKEVTVYPEPQAAYLISTSLACTNNGITFTNHTNFAEESVITYSWDFGDGSTSTDKSPEHVFTTAGTYTVILSAAIPGCTSTSTQIIEVKAGPLTLFEAEPVCEEQKVVFHNFTTGAGISGYEWDLGDGTFSKLKNPEHVYDSAGTYLVLLKTANEIGCETSYTQTVRVYSLPEPDFTVGPSCAKNEIQFTDATTDEDGNIVGWHWAFEQSDGTLLLSEEQNPTVTFAQPGTYEVVLTTTTTWLCKQTIRKEIVVDQVPEVAIGLEGGCLGAPSILADFSEPGALKVQSWYWRIGEEVFTDSAFTYTFPEAGTYGVYLQLNLENGCSVQDIRQILVDPLPQVDFSWSGTCPGQSAVFSSSFPATTYEWILDGQVVSTEADFEYVFTAVGAHIVQMTVVNEKGCANSISKEIEVEPAPVAAFSADRIKGVAPFTVQFINSSQRGVAYQWFFDDAQQSSSTKENPSFTFGETRDYQVKLVSFNAAGCTDTTTQLISVVEGKYDVVLSSVNLLQQNGQVQLVLGLENAGTITVNSMEVSVLVNNEYALSERFEGNLEMGQQENYSLKMQLMENSKRKLRFVCVELKPHLTLVSEELSVANNKLCLSFDNSFVMHEPYPNPGQDKITLEYLLPHEGTLSLSFFSAQGKLVQQAELKNQKAGLNQYEFGMDAMGKGIYFIKARFGGEEVNYRIIKD